MRLNTVFIRFYKSFNFDYLRKNHPDAKPFPWDMIGAAFFPYVRIPIDKAVTTVVGANESGKSHLLSAIEKGVSGQGILSEDFCRYSQFFAVVEGNIRTPDFGLEWTGLTDTEKAKVAELCKISGGLASDKFLMFRASGGETSIYLPGSKGHTKYPVKAEVFSDILPRTFQIDSEVALPESVSIHELINGPETALDAPLMERGGRIGFIEAIRTRLFGQAALFQTAQTVTQSAPQVHAIMQPIAQMLVLPTDRASLKDREKRIAQVNLARDLILKIARIAPESLQQLQSAIRDGSDGHANGIIEKINAALAARLNFPRFWVQDRDFSLVVSPREYDLVFTIRDRTGTQYSFKERSSGLKYFLSYYIQYLAHESVGPETEILLMDEPDAYLSSQAQQDLLKVFAAYATPDEPTRRPVQVIYVTHSPFLIDKNHADRIRVLEKGVGDEGTRIVNDVARNHYEPLRSAFGAFVGETTFIGNCNLMVEGPADQIFLAGAAAYLRSRGVAETETLDLNRLTIVPAGSASQIPYLVFLARGRDIERPAVIVLLDSDSAGEQALKELSKGGPRRRKLLDSKYILNIASVPLAEQGGKSTVEGKPIEIEDLIPISLCVRAAHRYATQFWGATEDVVSAITEESVRSKIIPGKSIYDAITSQIESIGEGLHLNKTGFMRAVIDELPRLPSGGQLQSVPDDINQFERNMRTLFHLLREMQHSAEKELSADRVSHKVERLKRAFLQDHSERASREQAAIFLRDVEEALDETLESDKARDVVRALRREFNLGEELLSLIEDFPSFREKLNKLQYAGRLATQEDDSLLTQSDPVDTVKD